MVRGCIDKKDRRLLHTIATRYDSVHSWIPCSLVPSSSTIFCFETRVNWFRIGGSPLGGEERHPPIGYIGGAGTRAWCDLLIHRETRRRIEGIMKKTRHNETGNSGCPRKAGGARWTRRYVRVETDEKFQAFIVKRDPRPRAPNTKFLTSANFCLESINYE